MAYGSTLILKALTMSDTSFGVSKSGRVVLPRAQVECCLDQLLRCGGATAAAASLKANVVPRLSVSLSILDEHTTEFIVTLKTWQNVVSGQHRPTFVLENTSAFMEAHPMKPGDILGIVVTADNRLQMRTDMQMAEILTTAATGIKRKNSNFASESNTTVAAVAAARLKRYNTAMDPPTPAPSSPEHIPTLSSGGAASLATHSSADLAAATALMFLSSGTNPNFSFFHNNEDASSSGISRSSPSLWMVPMHLGHESEFSMQSQIASGAPTTAAAAFAATPAATLNKINLTAPDPPKRRNPFTNRQQNPHSSSLPPPPLPAPAAAGIDHRRFASSSMVSPFQVALLNYPLDTLNTLPQFPAAEQQLQYHHHHINNNAAGRNALIQGLMQHEVALSLLNRPEVQSLSIMNSATMLVANAMRNYLVAQQQQQQQAIAAMERPHHLMNAIEMNNNRLMSENQQQQGVAILNASPEVPQLAGGGGVAEALLRHLVH